MVNKQLGTRHSEELLESITQKSEELGMSLTALVDWSLKIINALDIRFIRAIQRIGKDCGISAGDFIQKLLVGFVFAAAKKDREGKKLDSLEKAILIKCRVGKAWEESDEFMRETEFRRYIEEKHGQETG